MITPASQNQYQIRVRGSSQEGNGPWTSFSATNHLSPDRPEQLTVSSAGETSLTVAWNEPSGKGRWIDGYRIGYRIEYRRSGTGEWTNWPHQGNGTTATITGLQLRTRTLPTSKRTPSARLYTSKSQPPPATPTITRLPRPLGSTTSSRQRLDGGQQQCHLARHP